MAPQKGSPAGREPRLAVEVQGMGISRAIPIALAVVLGAAAPASAALALAGPGGFVAGYATPIVVVEKGEAITFYNGDVPQHNFVASDAFVPRKKERKTKWCSGYPKRKCPLFWSPRIGAGESTKVRGLKRLKPGREYGFLCTVHPNMTGTLIVR